VAFVVWWPSKVITVCFLSIIIIDQFDGQTMAWCPSHLRPAPAASPPQCPSYLRRRLMVGCCVPPSNGGHLRLTHPPPLSFLSFNLSHQTTGSHPPRTFQPGLASSPMQSLTSKPNIGWLLYPPIDWRLPKAKAPPSLYFSMPLILPTPSEQTNNNERNPNSSRPAQTRRGAAVP
jgi:hypothetical protein